MLNSAALKSVATNALIPPATMANTTLIQYITSSGFNRLQSSHTIFWTYIKKLPIYKDDIHFEAEARKPAKSVFARHYLKVEDVKVLVYKVLVETDNLENTLLVWFHFLPFKCFVGKDTFLLSLSFIFFSLSICLCFSNPSLLAFLLLDISIHS